MDNTNTGEQMREAFEKSGLDLCSTDEGNWGVWKRAWQTALSQVPQAVQPTAQPAPTLGADEIDFASFHKGWRDGVAHVSAQPAPMPVALPASVLEFDEFLNEPPDYEELRMVRDYRHEAYPKWGKVVADIRKVLAASPQPAVQPSESLTQEYFDLSQEIGADHLMPGTEVRQTSEVSDLEIIDRAKEVLDWSQQEDWLVREGTSVMPQCDLGIIHIDDLCKVVRAFRSAPQAAEPAQPAAGGVLSDIRSILDGTIEYHEQGMACGLEDMGIHDRYDAMRYGWDEAVDRMHNEIIRHAVDAIDTGLSAPSEPKESGRDKVDAAKWKQMAEFQYALRVYPDNLDLGIGALDDYMRGWTFDAARADQEKNNG